ncbi:GNAT family N-acetyltransferase [Muriicola sp. Z0-33]|uniref:GNAT family N-acetyltransferase n=1 Tax=Muriicola sp. Z0-33 TaxID=2816957 RepID=UPI0022385FAF|nr:GNAT family N-acetyltransferase [Muriicola sp. Z0-33]MCW5515544.1 GNAT family N-acetyltransferase [Muriicola sp. Z0-33]
MITRLDNQNREIAQEIRSVFQASYAIEAELLDAVDFPPLKRSLDNFLKSDTAFYGIWKKKEIAAIVEVNSDSHLTHIQSLVVAPKFFRQGLAGQLIAFVFETYESKTFTVETGAANGPATKLYKKFGFVEIRQWDTDHGVRKVQFERK